MEPLRQHLKKCFLLVYKELKEREESLKLSEPLWDSLINTAEQFHCCKRAQEQSPHVDIFQDFPDAIEMLQVKLVAAMSLLVEKLRDKLLGLDKVSKIIHTEWMSTWQLLSQNRRRLNAEKLVTGSATDPGLADMMMWLQRLNLLLQQDYAERMWIVESLDFDREDHLLQYQAIWKSSQKKLQQEIDTIFAYSHSFMGNG